MGGAFTAIGDDANTILANPAGLGFIEDMELVISSSAGIQPSAALLDYTLPEVAELGGIIPFQLRYDPSTGGIFDDLVDGEGKFLIQEGENAGLSFTSVLTDLGFSSDGSTISCEDLGEVTSWYDLVSVLDLLDTALLSLQAAPNVTYVNHGVGFSFEQGISILGTPERADEISISSERSAAAALARRFGPISLGINADYTRTATVGIETPEFADFTSYNQLIAETFGMSDPEEITIEALTGALFDGADTHTSLTFGAGAMISLGSLTAGLRSVTWPRSSRMRRHHSRQPSGSSISVSPMSRTGGSRTSQKTCSTSSSLPIYTTSAMMCRGRSILELSWDCSWQTGSRLPYGPGTARSWMVSSRTSQSLRCLTSARERSLSGLGHDCSSPGSTLPARCRHSWRKR